MNLQRLIFIARRLERSPLFGTRRQAIRGAAALIEAGVLGAWSA